MATSPDDAKLVADTARALFGDFCPPEATPPADLALGTTGYDPKLYDPGLWTALENSGLTLVSVPEPAGGSGGTLREAAALLTVAGEFGARVPLAETTLLGGWLLAAASLAVPPGPLTASSSGPAAMTVTAEGGRYRVVGTADRVPSARVARRVVLLASAARSDDGADVVVVSVDPVAGTVLPGTNLAGEPRDGLAVDTLVEPADLASAPPGAAVELRRRAALARCVLAAGAATRVLDLTLRHTTERVQFGRPIGRFQAVQQQVAELAAEVAVMRSTAQAAVELCAAVGVGHDRARLAVAAAKVASARSTGAVTRIAHQMIGAVGFTDEHPLRVATTRLWAWRDEGGAESDWLTDVGTVAVAAGRQEFWRLLTDAS